MALLAYFLLLCILTTAPSYSMQAGYGLPSVTKTETDAVQLRPSLTPSPSLQMAPEPVLRESPQAKSDNEPADTAEPRRIIQQGPSSNTIPTDSSSKSETVQAPTLKGSAVKTISISQALNEALMNNPRTDAIRKQLGITKSAYWQALTFPNPSLVLINGYGGLSFQQAVNTPIEPPWKVIFRLLVAKRQVAQTKLEIARDLWKFRAEIRRNFTELALAQETAETLLDLSQLAERLHDVAQKRFKAGDVPELDVLKARLATSQANIELRQGIMRSTKAGQQLNVILSSPLEDSISVPRLPLFRLQASKDHDAELTAAERNDLLPDFSKSVPPLKDFIDIAMSNRLELKIINKQIQVASAQLKSAIGNIVPTPEFMWGRDFSGNPPIPATGPDPTVGLLFNVLIELPVFNFQQGQIAQLRATMKQLRSELGGQKNVIVGEVSSAYNNLITARERIRTYQEHVLFDSYDVARLARRSYEVGQSDITATLTAQQANVNVRLEYLNAIMDYQLAFTALEQAIGVPLE